MKRTIMLFFAVAALAAVAFADEPSPIRPKPATPKSWDGSMVIRTRADVGIATLKINKNKLRELRAAIDQADDHENTAASVASFGRIQTVAAGLLLSLAVVMGGFVAFRRQSRTALSVAAVAAIGLSAVVVLANTPPPSVVGLTSRIFDKSTKAYGYAHGQIAIQINNDKDGEDVILEIPAAPEDKRSEE